MKNEIYVACVQRDENKPYQLEVSIEGKWVVLLEGDKDSLMPIYKDIVASWSRHFIPAYNLEIKPFDADHLMRGYQHTFYIKEKDGTTNS